LVSRKWITTLLSPEETATQTKAVFLRALELEELIDSVEDPLDTGELPDPDDEHQGRGDAIRAARRAGLERADQARRAYHRHHRTHRPETHP